MADPLVNSVPNVENKIALHWNDPRNPPDRKRTRPVSTESTSDEREGPDQSPPDSPGDVESGIGLHVNREV